MATPQSSSHPLHPPTSASKKSSGANNAAHTPAGPSSAPRSLPSPAAVRASGKTPAQHNKMGGTPMGLSLSQISLGMSPSGFTPAGGSSSMVPSMSDFGGIPRRDGDAERRRKMRAVLKRIGRRTGAVSEEGICRVARRVGFANDVDAEGEEMRKKSEGERMIGIAGKGVLIDVDVKGNRARGVTVTAGMGGEGECERAGKVLEGWVVKRGDLEGFGRELGRVAGLDRCSERGVSAFEAVGGVGKSLEGLWRWEVENEEAGERRVLRKRSGRPWMHARGRIGLGVDYWTTAPLKVKDEDAMDVDDQEEDSADFHTLHISAETCPAGLYPSVRISTEWLGDFSTLTKEESINTQSHDLPWQDPPPTYTTSEENSSDPPKLPDIRFLATLSPSLIVPYATANQILAELGGDMPQSRIVREWHNMLLSPTEGADVLPPNAAGTLGGTATVERKDGLEIQHEYMVNISKSEWGYRLETLPFTHPRGLIGYLPVFRQWAVFGSLVKEVLEKHEMLPEKDAVAGSTEKFREVSLDALLTPPSSQPDNSEDKMEMEEAGVRISVEVSTTPIPTLSVGFPMPQGGKMARVVVQVGRNVDIGCTFCEGFGDGEEKVRERVARGLGVCGRVGVWVEWLRRGGWKP